MNGCGCAGEQGVAVAQPGQGLEEEHEEMHGILRHNTAGMIFGETCVKCGEDLALCGLRRWFSIFDYLKHLLASCTAPGAGWPCSLVECNFVKDI